jgi:hypothetical protein
VSETMVGSAGLTVSALARRFGVGADTVRYYESAEFFRSARLFDDRVAAMVLSAARARVAPFGVSPHELTAAIDLAFSTPGRTRICLSSTGSNSQLYAPGWAMRQCCRIQTRMAPRPVSGPAC